jgi:hypothetical protein
MKFCDGPYCAQRRKHHDNPEPRGTPVALPEFVGTGLAFCSFTCAIEAGAFSLKDGPIPEEKWKVKRNDNLASNGSPTG